MVRQYNICCISQRKVTKKREENLCVPEKSLQSQIANTLVFLKKNISLIRWESVSKSAERGLRRNRSQQITLLGLNTGPAREDRIEVKSIRTRIKPLLQPPWMMPPQRYGPHTQSMFANRRQPSNPPSQPNTISLKRGGIQNLACCPDPLS